MKKFIIALLLLLNAFLLPSFTLAQEEQPAEFKEEYLRAEVINIEEEGSIDIEGESNPYQKVKVKVLEGAEKDQEIIIEHGGMIRLTDDQKVSVGQTVVLTKFQGAEGEPNYLISDKYRTNQLLYFALFFILLVFLVVGKKSIGALLGLALSLVVIIYFIVPQILAGKDPLIISIIGSLLILFVTLYLAHGFKKQTTLALISTFLALLITGILSVLFVSLAKLTGMGNEQAYSLQFGATSIINLKGLLLGGIIIGTLGVLDDITTTQTASAFELQKLEPNLKFNTLFRKTLTIGREHITSLVNTLFLAYAGAGLSLFIFFVYNPQNTPLWVILNSELIAEEIVRTLAGSIGLILAVPLSAALASLYLTNSKFKSKI